jgi:AcrR family transcriptional regulator
MPRLTKKELEKRMSANEKKVAYLLVENEFADKADKRTMQELADELGISRTALYNLKNKPDVARLMNMISDEYMDAFKVKVDKALTRLIDDGSDRLPSVKAIELFYKLKGLMIDRSITGSSEDEVMPNRLTQAELDAELKKLEDLL